MSVPQTIRELVERFERQLDAYRAPHYNETQLRREFLDPFFKVLGWDIDNEPECKVGNIRAYCSPNSYQGEPNMLRRYAGRGLAIITTAGCWQRDGPQVGAGRLKKGKVSTTTAMALLPTFRNLRASAS